MEYLTAALIGAAAGFAVGATVAWYRRRRLMRRDANTGEANEES